MNMFLWVKGGEIMGDFDTAEPSINVSRTIESISNTILSTNEAPNINVGTEQTSAQTQGGDYTCLVINEAGFDNSTVTLYISPEIVQQPQGQFVQDGDTVVLTCIGDSFPPPEYQWEKMNRSTGSFETITGQTNSTLVFTSIEHEDYGRYRCNVTSPIINEIVTSEEAVITGTCRDLNMVNINSYLFYQKCLTCKRFFLYLPFVHVHVYPNSMHILYMYVYIVQHLSIHVLYMYML